MTDQMRSHAIYSAILDSDSDIEFAETKRRLWPPQNDIAPVFLPVPALGGQSTRPLAGDLVPSPPVPEVLAESARPFAGENFNLPLAR